MESDRSSGSTSRGPQRVEDPPVQRETEPRPVFWKEIYWFVVICLGGFTLALLVLAPRLARHRSVLDVETGLRTTVARLSTLERQYEAAIQALEDDPFYREEVIRDVLRVKKTSEEYLKKSAGVSDN
jgi:hypothetical protein